MDWADSTLLSALQFLAPGFVAAWVLFSLTADRKLTDFQRVVQALIFSVFVKLVVDGLSWLFEWAGGYWPIGTWTQKIEFAWSVGIAIVFGGVLAHLLKTDRLYMLLRHWKVTSQTSRPSVWYSSFCDHPETYVVLQLKDDRRIHGWPREWPSMPGEGHLRLENAAWLSVDADGSQVVSELPVGCFVMVDTSEVKWVEFQPRNIDVDGGTSNGEEPKPNLAT